MLTDIVHHFYIIEGDSERSYKDVSDLLVEKKSIYLNANPDVYIAQHDAMNVDEARLLKDFFVTKTFGEGKRIAIVTTNSITREAQNALLKLTEEPAPSSHILFLVPDTGQLIATLLSRAEIVSYAQHTSAALGKSFVEMSIPERMAHVQKIITKKDKQKAAELINSLVAYIRTNGDPHSRKEIYAVQSYMGDKSSSIKLLLEHLSLILPVSK